MINLPQRYKIYIDKGSINFIHQNEVLQNEEYVETFEVFMENTADKILKNKIYRKYDIWIRCLQLPENYQSFIELFKPVAAAGGIVENEYHEILFIQRKKKWDLPKGHVELGESTVDAAVREVQEECGLQKVELLNSKPIFELQHI